MKSLKIILKLKIFSFCKIVGALQCGDYEDQGTNTCSDINLFMMTDILCCCIYLDHQQHLCPSTHPDLPSHYFSIQPFSTRRKGKPQICHQIWPRNMKKFLKNVLNVEFSSLFRKKGNHEAFLSLLILVCSYIIQIFYYFVNKIL